MLSKKSPKKIREEKTCSVKNHARYPKRIRDPRKRAEQDKKKVFSVSELLKIEPCKIKILPWKNVEKETLYSR